MFGVAHAAPWYYRYNYYPDASCASSGTFDNGEFEVTDVASGCIKVVGDGINYYAQVDCTTGGVTTYTTPTCTGTSTYLGAVVCPTYWASLQTGQCSRNPNGYYFRLLAGPGTPYAIVTSPIIGFCAVAASS
jgi:hypothetical protein